jgi:hypothetical protein
MIRSYSWFIRGDDDADLGHAGGSDVVRLGI